MSNGQAGDGPESIDDLTDFLVDNPEADESQEIPEAVEESGDEPDEDSPAEEGDEPSEDEPEQTSEPRKFKVTVKGEDGADQPIEVDEKELIAGYQRHADYTRKTQELGNKEREITQTLAQKHQEVQGHYLQQAQMARAAVLQLAALKTPEEMAYLAQTDRDSWVVETQRAQAVQGVLAQIEQGIQQEQARTEQQAEHNRQTAFAQAWQRLEGEGITAPVLKDMVSKAAKHYGLSTDAVSAAVSTAESALVLRDAIAYRELKAKKAEVTKKAASAPPLPTPRQTVPRSEQRAKSLNNRFAAGKAKLGDLAAFLENT